MANRAYLYSLSNRPTAYEDRPETISGLSEWAYDVPFFYRLLMSGDPQRCASLISDGLDGTPVSLHAISSSFEPGFKRVQRFADIIRTLIALPTEPAAEAQRAQPQNSTLIAKLRRLMGLKSDSPAQTKTASTAIEHLPQWLDEAIAFLDAHRDAYLLLETLELDIMSESDPDALRAMVDAEIERCRRVGEAFEALPEDIAQAARVLQSATTEPQAAPLDVFFGLRFDDGCDSTRSGATEKPLGLEWSSVLYFELFNREEFEAARREQDEADNGN